MTDTFLGNESLLGTGIFFSRWDVKNGKRVWEFNMLSTLGIEKQEAWLTRLNHEIKLNNFKGGISIDF